MSRRKIKCIEYDFEKKEHGAIRERHVMKLSGDEVVMLRGSSIKDPFYRRMVVSKKI